MFALIRDIPNGAAPDENDKRWSLQEEILNVFQIALNHILPDEKPAILPMENKDLGDYQCNNILTIWPQVMDTGTYKDCKAVGEAIMNNLPIPDMMECYIEGPGFVIIKLSRPWIAKSIRKMLIEGIDIWAPKLHVKKAIVDFSSPNIGEEMNMGHLRSTIIGDTIARMFEYSKVEVIRRSHVGDVGIQGGDKMYQNAYDQIREISQKDYEKVCQRLGVKVEEKGKSFYHRYTQDTLALLKEKGLIKKIGQNLVISINQKKLFGLDMPFTKGCTYHLTLETGGVDPTNALIDLTALRYQLEKEKAEWILYVSDLQQRDHTTLFVYAAKHAKWLATLLRDYPRGSHVGYGQVQGDGLKGFQNPSTQVVDLLDEAKSRCKAALVERARADKWTAWELDYNAEALACGAVKYADLKNNRLEKYKFNFDEMLNDKENTVVRLLHTYDRICAIIRKSGKDMNELKKVGEIELERDEERDLGIHLIQFNEVMEYVCKYLLPHDLCKYLYDLSDKFTNFNPNSAIGSDTSTSRLLLCKATEVVMKKCFHLLGITIIPVHPITTPPKKE